MAATFNTDLINEVGKCIGNDCLELDIPACTAPASICTAPLTAAVTSSTTPRTASSPARSALLRCRASRSKGVYVYMKHVALNDCETSRRVSTPG